ncbi:HsdR family type I site-specific deoxyribonuclease [Pontibacter sp. JH31]|uniref:Type I restriction enzyme endonuclease subunit n=1 Tax=Pontibacter aquaedesilientis TaxID=2766980 RepID=A0ABR7XEN3_9BACT|nr:HsdR family type I site-specific deoxyribonuclease [Pontibacter aquaedesilientis]MBD1396756.1 HsdR family type I site-specific deoxyribonuclease [Pontibacter aquaedesilientis]
METPSFLEDHISQIPALQFLQKVGYTYLTQEEALQLRGGKTTAVLLECVLREHLERINSITYKGESYDFVDSNLKAGIQALKDVPMQDGYMAACEHVYNLLTLGKALEQSIEGNKKSYTLQYINWQDWSKNVFHVTEEYSVMRAASQDHYRPDVVLFVNGIPLCVIECKRSDMKDPLEQAISQHLRNQQEDGIRSLYVYAQLCLSIATNQAAYATNATPPKFWAQWEEKPAGRTKQEKETSLLAYKQELQVLKNQPLQPEQHKHLFSGRYAYVRHHFEALEKDEVRFTKQDELLYGLCSPQRLLDLIYSFIVFDGGIKKVARYQQYFAINKISKRVHHIQGGKRQGGVIWHTQGSGKSLTMVMLAQAIAMDKSITNPKIVLVTDRTDLDDQISTTFKKCDMLVERAKTGKDLAEKLQSKSDAVVTTIINKFEKAVNNIKQPLTSPNIFVLIDEGHRTQYGTFNVKMTQALPNACFIAFTGTPLMKKEKSTASKFGGIIDEYPVTKAVEDGAVVPILYEGRHAFQQVSANAIDNYFQMVSESLTDYQKADLKKKFSRADQLNQAEQKMYAIAWDISRHYRDNWQSKGEKGQFKAQMVCPNKVAAIKYKEYLDEIGLVSCELVISGPDEREGEDSAFGKSEDKVKQFWAKMMNEHGTKEKYEQNIISRYKHQEEPEIIIVVDKLLTGFDAPKNTVLYITRNLKEHKLLQAIARVNRLYPGKDFGYVIDYYGILGQLDEALNTYSGLEGFDEDELAGTLTNIIEEVKKLPQRHSELWDIFKEVPNKRDAEAYEELLRDEALRSTFYDKLSIYARTLKIALSSLEFVTKTDPKEVDRYKEDAAFFLKLRASVTQRYSDTIDFKQYEGQIQKLIDKHIQTDRVETVVELVNIFDKDKFELEVEKAIGDAAKADRIASRTAKHIAEKMEEDPAFYKKFSEMLKETIKEYEEKRISEAEYLKRAKEMMDAVLSHTDNEIPAPLQHKEIARAYFGLCQESLSEKIEEQAKRQEVSVATALAIDAIMNETILDQGHPKIDWHKNKDLLGKLNIDIGDYLIDEVRDKHKVPLSFGEMDAIAEKCIEVAKIRYK